MALQLFWRRHTFFPSKSSPPPFFPVSVVIQIIKMRVSAFLAIDVFSLQTHLLALFSLSLIEQDDVDAELSEGGHGGCSWIVG